MHELHTNPANHSIELVTCEGMLLKMVLQRNAYLTGFGCVCAACSRVWGSGSQGPLWPAVG